MVSAFIVMALVLASVPLGAAPAASSFSNSLNSFSILMLARSCSLAGAFSSIKIFSHSPISANTCSLVRGPRELGQSYLMARRLRVQERVQRLEGAVGLVVRLADREALLVALAVPERQLVVLVEVPRVPLAVWRLGPPAGVLQLLEEFSAVEVAAVRQVSRQAP
jgi:hypothetical protein